MKTITCTKQGQVYQFLPEIEHKLVMDLEIRVHVRAQEVQGAAQKRARLTPCRDDSICLRSAVRANDLG